MTQIPAITIADHEALSSAIDGFLTGDETLTGLDLYYELERCTPLIEFHTMIRTGERNRANSGLQQSYGDHNRLLMLGLDKLVDGDVDWYRHRLDGTSDVSDEALRACSDAVADLRLTREILVAMWLAAALHDCGMLCGRGAYVDVEDGVVLSREAIETLCPESLRGLATLVLHHHDYIKGVFLGEVPASVVADDLETLAPALRPVALAGLGLVQVAGAASLGEGRLDSFRIEIFKRCVAGTALDDPSVVTRLARLLEPPSPAGPLTDDASRRLEHLDPGARAAVESFLTCASVHAWQRSIRSLGPDERMDWLVAIADLWRDSATDHVVLASPDDGFLAGSHIATAGTRVETALNGTRLLVVDL